MFLLLNYSSSTLLKEKQNFASRCGWVYSKASLRLFFIKNICCCCLTLGETFSIPAEKKVLSLKLYLFLWWQSRSSIDFFWKIWISVIWFWFERSFDWTVGTCTSGQIFFDFLMKVLFYQSTSTHHLIWYLLLDLLLLELFEDVFIHL